MKRLDTFIISKFLQLFAGAFFVCLFVFMMQFTWRYVDDLVGKGLTLDILAKFFGHMSLTLVPQSLPLAVLLASLITFGNMGENLELLSMKAAGVSLTRIMRPLIIFVVLVAGTSFYFQNSTSPDAQKNLRQLLLSMRQSQPAVEIPEGIFYNGIPNVNLFVEKKDVKSGMLYSVMIYKTDQGFDKTQILLADSGRLEMTADKLHLRLTLWSGAQFQSLDANTNGGLQWENTTMPYDRETFISKEFLIDFDSNFNLLEEDMIGNMPSAKNMAEIVHDADSMSAILDSTALEYVEQIKRRQMARRTNMSKEDSVRVIKDVKAHPKDIETIFAKADKEKLKRAKATANMTVQQMSSDLSWKNEVKKDEEKWIRRHWIEWHTKITLSLACLLFFFIGAPLGAIIRKGGLGTPSVISVGIFIFYYIINVSGMKMAREGNLNMIIGMWTSSFILAPAGVYLTFMSNRDSQVFNIDAYRNFFRKLLGLRVKRHLTRKEVIINAPDYTADLQHIAQLKQEFAALRISRLSLANYIRFRGKKTALAAPVAHLESVIDDLANTRDLRILQALNLFPFVTKRHLRRDRRNVLHALVKLEKSILLFLGRMELKKKETAEGTSTPAPAATGQRTSVAEVEQTPVIITLSDNTNYTDALEAVEQLKKKCAALRISRNGLINYFRYRDNKVIDDIVGSTRALIAMLQGSNDHMLQQIAKELPRMSRSNMKETRTNLMRTLAKLEKRVVAIIAHLAQLSHPDSLFEPLSTETPETAEDTPSAPTESAEAFAAEVTPPATDSCAIAETTHEALEAETEVSEETPFIPDVPETEEALEDDELEFIEEDRADYAAILVSIDTLKRECGALRISKWSIVNLFRYRDTSAIDSIVKRTKELRRQLADSDDTTLQQLRNELPRLSRKHLLRDRSAMMRLLTKIEKRINEV